MTEVEPVHIITTGGTFDKTYNPISGEMDFSHPSRVESILERANVAGSISVSHFMEIDILYMTDEHREGLIQAIKSVACRNIVVTHGTDTMPETARYLIGHGNRFSKVRTIVLTGAMVPASLHDQTDAEFNLGFAVASARLLPGGVYIAMNGQTFHGNNVKKDKEQGIFVPIS